MIKDKAAVDTNTTMVTCMKVNGIMIGNMASVNLLGQLVQSISVNGIRMSNKGNAYINFQMV